MRYQLIITLVMLLCPPLYAGELRLLSDTSETWRARETPQLPATDREKLAFRAAVALATVSEERLTAYYLGQRNSQDLVTVEEAPESALEGFHAMSSYLIRDGMIWSDTRIKYVAKPNPVNEQVAREIARDYLLGRISQVPIIFNGQVYVANSDDKCIITVTAKDETSVNFTYRYNSCN